MGTTNDYKNRALASLDSRWTTPVLCTLVFYLIFLAIGAVTNSLNEDITKNTISSLLYIAAIPLAWSVSVLFLDLIRGEQVSVSSLFRGYKKPWWSKSLLIPLLVGIYTLLWTMLLIIPGLIKKYSYAMSYFVYRDNKEMGCDAAIEESMRLMEGHKMDLFILDLSFIGWLLLSILTLGIGLLWLIPYVQAAHAHFYEDLIRERGASVQQV
jgi:uncharacterized membrane protein